VLKTTPERPAYLDVANLVKAESARLSRREEDV
jgi:hypothetical protein